MTAQAIRNRWPIREEKRQEIIDTLTTIATNPGACGISQAVSAAKALLDADRINIVEESKTIKKPELTTDAAGRPKLDFSKMTDEDLDRFLAGNS